MNMTVAQQAWSREQVEQIRGLWQRYDAQLVIAVLVLMGLGLVMVASASISIASRELGDPLYYFWRQGAYVAISLVLMLAATRIPLQVWRKLGPGLLGVCAVMLLLVFIPGPRQRSQWQHAMAESRAVQSATV